MARLDPHAVLAGRVRFDVIELIDLVHEVNPTDRRMHEREREERYALKARLQSLLLRRWGPEIDVQLDGEGIVILLHRPTGRDAAHAPISALDDDALREVADRLARAAERRDAARAGPAEGAPDPLAPGRKALARGDAGAAAAFFGAALEQGRVSAAPLLVQALVEGWQDEAACAWATRLPDPARTDPSTRAYLALAAARLARSAAVPSDGDVSRAEAWLVGAGGAALADACFEVASLATASVLTPH